MCIRDRYKDGYEIAHLKRKLIFIFITERVFKIFYSHIFGNFKTHFDSFHELKFALTPGAESSLLY